MLISAYVIPCHARQEPRMHVGEGGTLQLRLIHTTSGLHIAVA